MSETDITRNEQQETDVLDVAASDGMDPRDGNLDRRVGEGVEVAEDGNAGRLAHKSTEGPAREDVEVPAREGVEDPARDTAEGSVRSDGGSGVADGAPIRRWGAYAVRALVLVGALFALGRLLPVTPPLVVAVVWALLSALSALGATYYRVIDKTLRQQMLKDGGKLARLNGGRIVAFVVAFVLSAICVAGLFLDSPKWGMGEWLLTLAAVPLYPAVYLLFERLLGAEYEPLYRTARTTLWSGVVTGVLLVAAYLVLLWANPPETYASAADAFAALSSAYADSPSALLSWADKWLVFGGSLTEVAIAKLGEVSAEGSLVWRVLLGATAYFAVTSLVATCAIEVPELKRAFLPLEKPGSSTRPVKRFVAAAGVLPVLLVGAFMAADHQIAQFSESQEAAEIEQFIEEQQRLAVYVLDGKYYEEQVVKNLIAEANDKASALSAEAQATLVPLINESFDQRVANVDAYLDWYYSLGADYERLLKVLEGALSGDVEAFVGSYMEEQLGVWLEDGVDDTALMTAYEGYYQQAEGLRADLEAQLAEFEVTGVTADQIEVVGTLGAGFLDEPLAPSQKFLDGAARLGVSTVVTTAVGAVVGKKVVGRIVEKQVFKGMKKVLQEIAVKVVGGIAVGAGIGLGIGVGIDFGMLKWDEFQNRESYKAELVNAIEEERSAWLAAVQG